MGNLFSRKGDFLRMQETIYIIVFIEKYHVVVSEKPHPHRVLNRNNLYQITGIRREGRRRKVFRVNKS
jgi:hypothetical protein